MEEKISKDKRIKKLEIVSKLLLILFICLSLYFSFFNPQQELTCFGKQINLLILFLPLILAVILETITILVRVKDRLPIKDSIKSFSKFLIFSLLFPFILSVLFVQVTHREKLIDVRKVAELKWIYDAQEKFLKDKSRYAISLEELEQPGYIPGIADAAKTHNIAFEGSADFKTWKAQVDIKQYEREICSIRKTKQIYLCNEKGCSEEVVRIKK